MFFPLTNLRTDRETYRVRFVVEDSMEVHPAILAAFGPPPPGIDLASSQQIAISVVAIVCTSLAAIALALRLWARNLQSFGMMTDDWLMVVALVCLTFCLTSNFLPRISALVLRLFYTADHD